MIKSLLKTIIRWVVGFLMVPMTIIACLSDGFVTYGTKLLNGEYYD